MAGATQLRENVLYIVQQACIQMSLPTPLGVYDSQDDTALLMGSAVNLAGIMCSDAFDWQMLKNELVLTGDGVRTTYDLPDDWSRAIGNTGWSTAIRRPVTILGDVAWSAIASWLSQSFFVNPACRIYQDQFQFMSPIPNLETVTFTYMRNNWVQTAASAAVRTSKATANGDIPLFDWLLMALAVKVKFRELKGFDTTAVQQDFLDRLQQLTNKDELGTDLPLSGVAMGGFRMLDNFYNTPDTNIG